MKAVALLLIPLFIFLALAFPVSAYYDIEPSDDTYSFQNPADVNHGTETLTLINSYSIYNGRSFWAFNLSQIAFAEDISSAILYVYQSGLSGGSAYMLVSNTTYFDEGNLTWNNQPINDTLQTNVSMSGGWYNFSVTDAVSTAHKKNETVYLMAVFDIESNTTQARRTWYSKENGVSIPYLRVFTASGSGCNHTDGRVTGSACLDQDTYYTSDGCNDILTDCPTGSYCVQLTPQINVTSDLYENYTSCQITTNLGLRLNCWNICYYGSVIWSNCAEDGCKVCPDETGAITYGSTEGFFTDTYYTNQSSVSVPYYTVACGYPNGTIANVINETGGETTVIDILTRAGNNVTQISPSGEILAPEDEGISGLKEWLNAGMGSNYGSDIISLIVSGVIAIMIFINVKSEDKGTSLLFGSFLLVATAFSFFGLLTAWFIVLESGLIFVLIFWKVRGG